MIEFSNGLKLVGSKLHLDAKRATDVSFVSHAHGDHLHPHKTILASIPTVKFCKYKLQSATYNLIPMEYNRKMIWEDFELEILPAGHILGSSQILVRRENITLLYSGDFRLKPSFTAEKISIKQADILVMECTYGHPKYCFPEREEELTRLLKFIDNALSDGYVPILFVYSLGKGQELMKFLGDRRYKLSVHRSLFEYASIYNELGVKLQYYELFNPKQLNGKVVLFPPQSRTSIFIESIEKKRTAILTGWAVDKEIKEKFNVDDSFIISDHADFNELLEFVRLVSPKLVYTVHGITDFYQILRKNGFNAKPGEALNQLSFF